MSDATIPIVFVTSTTIFLAPVGVANAFIVFAPANIPAIIPMPGLVAEAATIDVAAVYQPPLTQFSNPKFRRDAGGRLIQVDYDGSKRKVLTYGEERLVNTELFDGLRTLRKTFVYDASGGLAAISESFV